jgi:hypothetical protein
VLAWIDVGKATTLDHKVKCGRCDDPQRFVEGREVPAELVQPPRRLLPDRLLEAGALAIGSQGAAKDLRRIIGRQLRLTHERASSPGDQRCTKGGAAFQEPAAAGDLPGGCGVRS